MPTKNKHLYKGLNNIIGREKMTKTQIFDTWTELPNFIESLDNGLMCIICKKYPVTQDNNTVCNQCISKDPEQYDINSKTNVAKRFNK